jgi:hypothetical protein
MKSIALFALLLGAAIPPTTSDCGGWCGKPCDTYHITDYSTNPPTIRVIKVYDCNEGMPWGYNGTG